MRRSEEEALDDDERVPPGQRSRIGLLIGAVVGVVILGLAIGYTVLSLTRPSAAPGVAPSVPGTSSGPTTGTSSSPPEPEPSALLTDASLITPQSAAKIDSERTWKVQLTQKGQSANSPQPACLGGDPVEGQPIPQQSMLRVLTSTGKNPPAVLQQADAYASPEEAAQAYAVAARMLGGCTMAATYIDSGALVTGLGDQCSGGRLTVTEATVPEFRTVILTRTGRVVDAVDVAQPAEAVGVDKVALAAADVVNAQCQTAAGTCAQRVQTRPAPPPVGGDAPGFLATADLPPVGTPPTGWVGNKPATPDSDVLRGSGCETVDWAKEEAVDPVLAHVPATGQPQQVRSRRGHLDPQEPRRRDEACREGARRLERLLEAPADRVGGEARQVHRAGRAEHRDRGLDHDGRAEGRRDHARSGSASPPPAPKSSSPS